jgi:hypothetical protein
VAGLALAAIPLVLWQDYLFSIYRRTTFANQNQLAAPFEGFIRKWETNIRGVMHQGIAGPSMRSFVATAGLTAQAIYLIARSRTHYASVWWRLALPYVVLMFLLHFVVWGGHPGAAMRVLLPITIAFNVLLASEATPRFWIWYVLGNAALIYAPQIL